jgi:hypothetical protein
MSKTNGAAEVPADSVELWPGSSKACKEYQCSPRTLNRLVERGLVQKEQARDGTFRFHPEQLGQALASKDVEREEQAGARVLLDGGVDLLKQAHSHIEKMYAPAHEASAKALAVLVSMIASLTEQNSKLLETHLALIRAREEALDESHVRSVVGAEALAKDERKREMIQLLKTWFKSRVGGGDNEALATFLAGLSPEQVATIGATLSPEQQAQLQAVLG